MRRSQMSQYRGMLGWWTRCNSYCHYNGITKIFEIISIYHVLIIVCPLADGGHLYTWLQVLFGQNIKGSSSAGSG